MNYVDLFYSIIHEIEFFNSYFYEQYLLDLDIQIVYDIQNKKQHSLSSFLSKNNIHLEEKALVSCKFVPNHLLITPDNYPQYRIILKINTSLSYFKKHPTSLLSNTFTPLYKHTDITSFLKPSVNQNIFILYFDLLTNQNLENPETKNYIYETIHSVFQKEICYFQQTGYHNYFVLLKNIKELEIYNICRILKNNFQSHSKIYVLPRFLLVECHNLQCIDNILLKIKKFFRTLTFDTSTLVIKEKLEHI